MTNQDFDRLVNSIRDDVPNAEVTRAAADRVRERLGAAEGLTNSARSFAPISTRIARGQLAEGRRMLVEDHLHSCVACRREYSGAQNVLVIPIRDPGRLPGG